jgi:hypothetical protein
MVNILVIKKIVLKRFMSYSLNDCFDMKVKYYFEDMFGNKENKDIFQAIHMYVYHHYILQ